MMERERFEAWWDAKYGDDPYELDLSWEAWQACAAQKDEKIASLLELLKESKAVLLEVRRLAEAAHD